MSYVYVTRDGQRLEEHVAADFDRMNAAFNRDTGLSLIITSGTRTDAQQEALFRERYVLSGQVNGRRVYDTRRWLGLLWYRISDDGTVAVPGTSNHQESGPNGPRSIDIDDTGADRGVTYRGTARDKWMEGHAGDYGFENEGYKFGEAWHKTYRKPIGAAAASLDVTPIQSEADEDDMKIITYNNISYLIGAQFIHRSPDAPTTLDYQNLYGTFLHPLDLPGFQRTLWAHGISPLIVDQLPAGQAWSAERGIFNPGDIPANIPASIPAG